MNAPIPAWVDGVLTPIEKLRAHVEGLRHMAVSVFVMSGDAILIQRRAMGKYHTPGLWANTCCTHPLWEEEAEVCARRRLDEELGITGLVLRHRGQIEYRAHVSDTMVEHEVVDVFVAEATQDLRLTLNPDEVIETLWIDREALLAETRRRPERFTPWLKIYLEEHAERIFADTVKQATAAE